MRVHPSNVCISKALKKNKRSLRVYERLAAKELVKVSRSTSTVTTTARELGSCTSEIAVMEDGCTRVTSILGGLKVRGISKVVLSLKISSFRLSAPRHNFACQDRSTPLSVQVSGHRHLATESVIGSCDRTRLFHVVHSCKRSQFTGGVTGRVMRTQGRGPVRAAKRLGTVVHKTVPVGMRIAKKRPSGQACRTVHVRLGRRLSMLHSALSAVVSLLSSKKEVYVVAFRSLRSHVMGSGFGGGRGPYAYPDGFPIYMYKGGSGKHIIAEGPILPSRGRLRRGDESGDTGLHIFRHIRSKVRDERTL